MIIDGLKQFLIEYYTKHEHNICPVKNFQESYLRSIIQLKNKAIVIESYANKFQVEIVDNSSNFWKTLELNTFNTEQEVFDEIARILEENPKLTVRQQVAAKQAKVFSYLKNNGTSSISQIVKALNFDYQETARLIANLRKSNKVTQNRNSYRNASYEVVQ